MTNTLLHGFDGGMLQPSPLKEISPRDLEQWGDTKEVTCASLRGKKPKILRTKKFLGLPCSLLVRIAAPLNFEESNHLTPRDSVLLTQYLDWVLRVRHVGIER
jgi:hypothetical protein